jgi:hypothetical protein
MGLVLSLLAVMGGSPSPTAAGALFVIAVGLVVVARQR